MKVKSIFGTVCQVNIYYLLFVDFENEFVFDQTDIYLYSFIDSLHFAFIAKSSRR